MEKQDEKSRFTIIAPIIEIDQEADGTAIGQVIGVIIIIRIIIDEVI